MSASDPITTPNEFEAEPLAVSPGASHAQALELLRRNLPPNCLITDAAGMRPYESDGLTAIRGTPWVVALPQTADQVRTVIRICHEHSIPVVPRGAGTGLSGGARPREDCLVLGLSRLNRIVEIDTQNAVARVQPGVRNLAISEAAAQHGLFYAPDPSSQIACSIGGNVAENSGGVHCLKYGLTVHNVVALRVLLADGTEFTLGGHGYDRSGPDLLALLCGSEGMLGVVLEVTVKLLPVPPCKRVLMGAFHTLEDAGEAVRAMLADGLVPAGLEMMDALAIQAAEAFAGAGYPTDAAAILLCELDGIAEEVSALAQMSEQIFRAAGAYAVHHAEDAQAQARMWAGRKGAFPAVGRLAPDYYCMDGTIPRHRLSEVLAQISALSQAYDLQVANVFHAGDGNLHPLILYDANAPGELMRVEEMGGRILELCVEVGGTVTGEHGVGVEKLNQMCVQFGTAELSQFADLKSAFDPHGLMNPGKAVPTLARCVELGGHHVHAGTPERFVNLDRF